MSSLRPLSCLALALALGLGPLARPGLAQDEPAPEPGMGLPIPVPETMAPPPGIEAIEVTGERLNDANVQDEAQAITAFTGAELDRANIVNVDSLAVNVPGLHVGQSASAPIITLRGIGTENASLTGEPGVAFHIDGINMGRPAAARVAFFDLETLDVKRGPQGLLGGKNSTSGSINLISKKPTDEYEVTGDVLMGNYDRVRLRGAVNVPVGEFMATRLALFHETRDGFLDNLNVSDSSDPFDADEFGLRAHMRVMPASSLELLFSYNYFKQDGVGPQADAVPIPRTHSCPVAQRMVDNRGVGPGEVGRLFLGVVQPIQIRSSLPYAAACTAIPGEQASPPSPSAPFGLYRHPITKELIYGIDRQGRLQPGSSIFDPAPYDDTDPRSIRLDSETQQRNRYWGWTTTADWEVPTLPLFGATEVKLLGGFQRTEQNFTQDFDATDRPLSQYTLEPDNADQYSGELQWMGAGFEERLDWQASLFHLHEKGGRKVDSPTLTQSDGGLFSEQTTDNKAYGAALHGGLQVIDSLRFTLGGRWIKDRKSTNLYRVNRNSGDSSRFRGCQGSLGLLDLTTPIIFPAPDCENTYRGTAWGTGLEWRPFGDDHMLYAKLDRGYKSGGFRAGTIGEYEPEKIWAYALGTKSQFFDQRLTLNLEGFFYAYDALQLVILDGLALRTENTDARMYGWDLEAMASPIEGLNLSAVVSFLKTEALEYYSLDPTTEPPGPSFNYAGYESWHNRRLSEREEAEAAEVEAGLSGPLSRYETRPNCVKSPTPSFGNLTTTCGTLSNTDEPGPVGDYLRSLVGGLDDFSGNDLSRSPKWKYTLSGEYEILLGGFGSLTPRIQYTWQDDTYFRVFNRAFDLQDDYHTTDAKLIWTSPEETWSVEAFVQNIEDVAAKQNILIGPRQFGAPPFAWYNPPRFYGMQVGFRY
jgi:outer membrane receptor protein involved in Fe transport